MSEMDQYLTQLETARKDPHRITLFTIDGAVELWLDIDTWHAWGALDGMNVQPDTPEKIRLWQKHHRETKEREERLDRLRESLNDENSSLRQVAKNLFT